MKPPTVDLYNETHKQARDRESLKKSNHLLAWEPLDMAREWEQIMSPQPDSDQAPAFLEFETFRTSQKARAVALNGYTKELNKDPEKAYRDYLLWATRGNYALSDLPEVWFSQVGHAVPTSTGPWWVVGPPELVVEAVGKSSLALVTPNGNLVALRPQSVAIPESGPERWYLLLGARLRQRAGLLWIPPQGIGD